MDPYACAVSDVYQDLFGEGLISGKGIYDVDAFEAALEGAFPRTRPQPRPSRRDLRAGGLVSDIEFFDEFPARYDVAAAASTDGRAAIGSCCPGSSVEAWTANGDHRDRAIPLVGRWKMIDNLRRSLSAPAGCWPWWAGGRCFTSRALSSGAHSS